MEKLKNVFCFEKDKEKRRHLREYLTELGYRDASGGKPINSYYNKDKIIAIDYNGYYNNDISDYYYDDVIQLNYDTMIKTLLEIHEPEPKPMNHDDILNLWQDNGHNLLIASYAKKFYDTITAYNYHSKFPFKGNWYQYDIDTLVRIYEYSTDNGKTWHKFIKEVK